MRNLDALFCWYASCKVAAARRLIVAFDSGTQPITTDTTITQARAFTQIRPDTGWPCSDRIEPRPHRREECERQRGTNPETFGKPARGRQWLGTSPEKAGREPRHLDLTTRSGAEGRYFFNSAPDGSNQ